jgi:5-methylcytosine-specific restriction endonuclease McrA
MNDSMFAATRSSTDRRPALSATPESLSDDQLLRRLGEIMRDSRRVEAELVAHIGEVDARRLYAREGCSSMFAYCVELLHLSEPETNLRIVVARAARRHPLLLEMLGDGRLHLSGIALLAPHLTVTNRDEVLARATHATKRHIEELVAGLAPRPDVPTTVRRLPDRGRPLSIAAAPAVSCPAGRTSAGGSSPEESSRPDETISASPTVATAGGAIPSGASPEGPVVRRDALLRGHRTSIVEPLAPERFRIQFTAGSVLRDKLERLATLLHSSVPDGDLAALIEDAVTERIARLEAKRLAAVSRPRKTVAESDTRPGPRSIPAAVRRAVRQRDGDRCAFVGRNGRRCTATANLQFHHRHPHGLGGDRSPANIALFCRIHNAHESEADYGRDPSWTKPTKRVRLDPDRPQLRFGP